SRSRQEPRTMTRQTMPPPERRHDVELGRPAPLPEDGDGDGAVVPKLGRATAPSESRPQSPPVFPELVGAPRPTPPLSSGPGAAYSALSRANASWIER